MLKLILAGLLAIAAFSPLAFEPRITAPTAPAGFHRGVNILAYDPLWDDPSRAHFGIKQFEAIRGAGFDFVRVDLFVFRHMDRRGIIDPRWLSRLDWVVRSAQQAQLAAIIDVHESDACSKDASLCRTKLDAVWRQLASRYASEPDAIAFELLNEPHGAVDPAAWNSMISGLLPIIREANPTRTVVIAASGWKDKSAPPPLRLPANDRHIVFTFHYYDPYRFTHQGARFSSVRDVHGVTWGSAGDRLQVRTDFDEVARWARSAGRPVLLGEFGVYDKSGIPMPQRALYSAVIACEAERHGFAWSYWQFDHDFVVWDRQADDWVMPIKNALLPPGADSDNRC